MVARGASQRAVRPQAPRPSRAGGQPPGLLSAQGGQSLRRRRLVRVRYRVVCGTLAASEQGRAAHGWHINTAFLERRNLTLRQPGAAGGRRVMTRCTGEEG
jgi:hypothetical protein